MQATQRANWGWVEAEKKKSRIVETKYTPPNTLSLSLSFWMLSKSQHLVLYPRHQTLTAVILVSLIVYLFTPPGGKQIKRDNRKKWRLCLCHFSCIFPKSPCLSRETWMVMVWDGYREREHLIWFDSSLQMPWPWEPKSLVITLIWLVLLKFFLVET